MPNPNMTNSKTKKVLMEKGEVHYDSMTGEVITATHAYTAKIDAEPNYIKIYTDCMLVFNDIDVALSPYIIAFGAHMTYANSDRNDYRCTVRTDELTRSDVATRLGVSDQRVKQAIKTLIDAGIFIPIEINGKKKRGIYYVNPWVIGKGDWRDIRQLRGEFEFTNNKASVLKIDGSGERKVIMAQHLLKLPDAPKLEAPADTTEEVPPIEISPEGFEQTVLLPD